MAYNRKMRKFEGTCYIPGEQLAMMAKYYRGANLNLNLTLFEDDLATMQETLDQACWCSKLDEVDRMKMSHMKGNEWRIAHEHCMKEAQQAPGGRNPKVYPALPQSSRSTVGKVERGTSALSLYDRERVLVKGGRYQRDDYSELRYRRDDCCDHRNCRDDGNDPRKRRYDYNYPRNRRGYHPVPRNVREGYDDTNYRRVDFPGQPVHNAQVVQNENRTGRNMGGPPDRRFEMESEAAISSLPEVPGEIRCAVCNLETCLVCKNHLYSRMCQCKCPVSNAGLCNRCSQEPCEEEEQVAQETGGNKMDMSSMMLTMMMSSMLKQPQPPESVCCCKPSRDNSESSSCDSSDEKVHKVYLYDCHDTKKNKKTKKSKKTSSDSSMACGCCKRSRKPKTNSDKNDKGSKTSGEEISESDAGQKRRSTKGKGSKDSNSKPKRGDSNSDSDHKPKYGKENNRECTVEDHEFSKSSKKDRAKSDKPSKSMRTNKGETRGSRALERIDSKNVQFLNANITSSPRNSPGWSTSEATPKEIWRSERSHQKSPSRTDVQWSELIDTEHNVPDLEPSKRDIDTGSVEKEFSTSFSLGEFIVALPKIQSNLQSLMSKLNQMERLNNQMPYPEIDPSMANAQLRIGGMQTHHDVPLISSPQNLLHSTPGSLQKEHTQLCNNNQKPDPTGNPVLILPPTISPGSSKDEPTVLEPSNAPPKRYNSIINFSNLGESSLSNKLTAGHGKKVLQIDELAQSTKQTQSTIKYSSLAEGSEAKDIIENHSGNQWSFQNRNRPAHAPSLIFPSIDQDIQQPHSERGPTTSKVDCKKEHVKIHNYQKGSRVNEPGFQSLSNVFSLVGSHNVEIIELPETKSCNQGSDTFMKSSRKANKAGTAVTTTSPYDGETIFQSYNRESSATSNQDLTDYASFTEGKCFKLSPATSIQQATYHRENEVGGKANLDKSSGETKISQKHGSQNRSIITKFSKNCRAEHTLQRTRAVLKAQKRVTFKAKQSNPLSLEKLVQGCTLRGSNKVPLGTRKSVNKNEKSGDKVRLDEGVHTGKRRRSKSDSSLSPLNENTLGKDKIETSARPKTPRTPKEVKKAQTVSSISAGKNHEVILSKNKRSTSPIKEKSRCTVSMNQNNLSPKRNKPLVPGKFSFQNLPSDCNSEQTDSVLKMSDEYVTQAIGSQSYIVSKVEVKSIENHVSSTDMLEMVQGIASSSLMNATTVSSVVPQTGSNSFDDFDIIPLLPLSSTTPTDGHESRIENQSGAVAKKQVSFDDEAGPNTPHFLRKSRVQVEQLKRAHETIRSMIKNVNEVISHIDSDSKIGIKSKARSEDKERQSYFVHLGDADDNKMRQSHCDSQDRRDDTNHFERRQVKPGTPSKPAHSSFEQNRAVQEMFLSVNRVINSVMIPSDQSNETREPHWPSENTTPRARRDFFVLNSENSSSAFTESLRRSLENDTSRPLATQRVPSPEWDTSQRPRSSRPLKRRSWFPPAPRQ